MHAMAGLTVTRPAASRPGHLEDESFPCTTDSVVAGTASHRAAAISSLPPAEHLRPGRLHALKTG